MEAWMSLLQAHAAVLEGLESRLVQDAGLPLSWHEVLVRLADAPEGKMRMQDLARSILLSKSGVTRLVDRMLDAGMVKRTACTADRRVTYAQITGKGRAVLDRALPVFVRGFDEHFARHLSEAETRTLRAALEKVLVGNGVVAKAETCPSAYHAVGGGARGSRRAAAR
jgi:DNA-binding MarR family transcriptional regulator